MAASARVSLYVVRRRFQVRAKTWRVSARVDSRACRLPGPVVECFANAGRRTAPQPVIFSSFVRAEVRASSKRSSGAARNAASLLWLVYSIDCARRIAFAFASALCELATREWQAVADFVEEAARRSDAEFQFDQIAACRVETS
jgi:hypothetical protein